MAFKIIGAYLGFVFTKHPMFTAERFEGRKLELFHLHSKSLNPQMRYGKNGHRKHRGK